MATVTVALAGEDPVSETVEGLTVHVARAGAPEHESVTVAASPPCGAKLSTKFAVPPGDTVTDEDEPLAGAIAKSCPVPESGT